MKMNSPWYANSLDNDDDLLLFFSLPLSSLSLHSLARSPQLKFARLSHHGM